MLMIKLINDIRFGSIYYNQIRSNRVGPSWWGREHTGGHGRE